MVRTLNRLRKQVDSRVAHRQPRGNLTQLANILLAYALELKTFHVKHLATVGTNELLSDAEKELLAAGEHLEGAVKQWLAGDK